MLLNDLITCAVAAAVILASASLASERPRPGQRAIKKDNRPVHNGMPILGFQTSAQEEQPTADDFIRGPEVETTTNGVEPTGEDDHREYKRLTAEEYAKTGYRLSSVLVLGNLIDSVDPQRKIDDAGRAKKNTAELTTMLALIQSDERYNWKTDPVDQYQGDRCTNKDPHIKTVTKLAGEVLANCKDIDRKKFSMTSVPEGIAKHHPKMAEAFAAAIADAEKRVKLERNAGVAALQKAFVIILKAQARSALKQLGWTRRDLIPKIEEAIKGDAFEKGDLPFEKLLLWTRASREFSVSFRGIIGTVRTLQGEADLITPDSRKTNEVTEAELKALQADGTWPWIKDILEETIAQKQGLNQKQNAEVSQLKLARLINIASMAEFEALSNVLEDFEHALELRLNVELHKRTQGEDVAKQMAAYQQEIVGWDEQAKTFADKIASCNEGNFPSMNFLEGWSRDARPLYNIMQRILIYRISTTGELAILDRMLGEDAAGSEDSLDSEGIEVPDSDEEDYQSSGSLNSESEGDDEIYRLPQDVKIMARARSAQLEKLNAERQEVFRRMQNVFHLASKKSLELSVKTLEQDEARLKDAKSKLSDGVPSQATTVGSDILAGVFDAEAKVVWFDPKGFALDRDGVVPMPDTGNLREKMQNIRGVRRKLLKDDINVDQLASLDTNTRRYLTDHGPVSLLERVRIDKSVAKLFRDSITNMIEAETFMSKKSTRRKG